MTGTLRRLWADDRAAVVSTELVLIIGILVFGLIPGLVALRNSSVAALSTAANLMYALLPRFTFSEVTLSGGGTAFVIIGGFNFTGSTVIGVDGTLTPPQTVTYEVVNPAP